MGFGTRMVIVKREEVGLNNDWLSHKRRGKAKRMI